jgi:hypothetical protein
MPAAHFLLVERESADVFQITWWDYTGSKRVERANREQLSRRCDVLTTPDRPDKGHRVVMVRCPDGRRLPYAEAMKGKEHESRA